MDNTNKVFLTGNLTKEPELKYTSSGTAVCKFDIAVNRSYKKGDEWIKEVAFVKITTWGKQAEFCADYRKGCPVFIEGYLKQNSYTSKDGKTISYLEVAPKKINKLETFYKQDNNQQDNDLSF